MTIRRLLPVLLASMLTGCGLLPPPETDADALARLTGEIDTLHEQGVAQDASFINPSGTRRIYLGRDDSFLGQSVYQTVRDPRADYRNYRTVTHREGGTTYYHRGCSVCDQNCHARTQIDAIYRRAAAREEIEAMKPPRHHPEP